MATLFCSSSCTSPRQPAHHSDTTCEMNYANVVSTRNSNAEVQSNAEGPVDWPVGVEENILDTETNKLKCSVGDKETGILRLRLLQSHLKGKTVLGLTFLRDPYASIFSALGHDLWKRRITQDSMAGKLQKYLDGSCTTWNTTTNRYRLRLPIPGL